MTLNTSQTVREIAVANPATVRIFESLGVDYCCGGKHSLEEACERANVPLARALELLRDVKSEAGPPASPGQLTRYIVDHHHKYVREEAPRLNALLAKVIARHGEQHPELAQIGDLFHTLSEELLAHMQKEEQVLFPLLEKMDGPPLDAPIARMLADHDDAGALTAKIRALSGNFQPPANACPSYRGLYHGLEEFERDLHQHVHLENNILFPASLSRAH
jgi:regulator of cell morphogenesis and NO signaling